jgi:carboxyl-terminal processing protease
LADFFIIPPRKMMRTYSLFIFFAAVSISIATQGQPVRNFRNEAFQLRNVLREKHVAPRPFDDQLSTDVFDMLLSEADPDAIYFDANDIKWLEPFRHLIDDEVEGNAPWVFLSRFRERFESALKRARSNIEIMQTERLSLDAKELYDAAPESFAAEGKELFDRQRLWLKVKILEKISLLSLRDSTPCEKLAKERQNEVIQKIKKGEIQAIDRFLNGKESLADQVGFMFFHAITLVFDPHTLYLSAADLKNFMGQLATEDYYFGFTVIENEAGEIEIASLVPGGPAWKSGELHVSDILISMEAKGQDAIDLSDVDLDQANELIDGLKSDAIEFTVRKQDGVIKKIPLQREKMTSEESFVRSFVLSGERKFGYIHLPDFYTRWGSETEGSRCASDVAKEIIKLKRDGIEGLILDLRFNGGGSLFEAMAMAGIFIDEGPLGQLRDRERTVTLKDVNRGTVYDGPLVLMVNGRSASASEFLAAAIQDYNRGLIVGSTTYGKATGQVINPINPNLTGSRIEDIIDTSEGFIKITIERLYRVTGKTLQGRGLVPDITLPDLLTTMNLHEGLVPFALNPDSIDRKTYYRPLAPLNVATLRQKSQQRIAMNADFVTLQKNLANEKGTEETTINLQWSAYCSEARETNETNASQIRALSESPFTVLNNSSDINRLKVDSYADAYNALWFDRLKHDMYLHETYFILNDFVNPQKP